MTLIGIGNKVYYGILMIPPLEIWSCLNLRDLLGSAIGKDEIGLVLSNEMAL